MVDVDSDGKIFSNQFTLEGLRKKFNEKEFKIKTEKDKEGYHTDYYIIDRKTGKKLYKYRKDKDYENFKGDVAITKYDSSGKNAEEYVLLHNHREKYIIGTVSRFSEKSGKKYFYDWDETIEKVYDWGVIDDKGTWDITKVTFYSKNKPYKEFIGEDVIANHIVDNLVQSLSDVKTNKNSLLIQLSENINDITHNNVWEILYDYKNKTGQDLLDDIQNLTQRDNEFENPPFYVQTACDKMINHIKDCQKYDGTYTDSWLSNHAQSYITDRLINDLSKGDTDAFKEDLKMIGLNLSEEEREKNSIVEFIGNPYIYKVLNQFQEKAENLYKDDVIQTNETKGILYTIAKSDSIQPNEKANLLLETITTLGYITDEPKIKQEIHDFTSNQEFMELIINNCTSGKYCEDIKADMVLNKNDPERILVDFKRLNDRNKIRDENIKVTKPNGKIDVDFKQGNTGDCWLLAGVISCVKKPEIKTKLESLLTVEKNGDVTVNLKGVNKKYKIPYEEIKSSNHLSGGDGDMRALELAFDKYIRELAYNREVFAKQYDINGNNTHFLYEVLFGKGEDLGNYNPDMNEEINNPNKAFCLGASDWTTPHRETYDALINEKGEPVNFVTGHAYAVIKADEEYVYLVNPWDSKETLRITHEKLEKIKPSVGCSNLI